MEKPTLLVAGSLMGAAKREAPGAVPIEYITNHIRKEMHEFGGGPPKTLANRVFIVRSETGSGKSTVLPVYIFRLLRAEKTSARIRLKGPGVICTQPRILTAQTLARDMSSGIYPDLVMGETVGYQTGPLNEKPLSGLIYATAGSLLAQLRTGTDDDLMGKYRFILVDEAHERSLEIDTLLLRLKTFLKRNLGNIRLPFVILTSATLPVAKYATYFELTSANVFEVEGRPFEIKTSWPILGTNDYPREAARLAVEIHELHADDPPGRGDILIFLPGMLEISAVVRYLTDANLPFRKTGSKIPPFLVLSIYREVILSEGPDYRRLKEGPGRLQVPSLDGKTFLRPGRRVIVATVVAETGITIETLKYVIDCGWNRTEEAYFPGRFRGLVTRPAPRSRIEQRRGRVGRKFPGQFYPLYTRKTYSELPVEQLPDIVTVGVSSVFLDIVKAVVEQGGESIFRLEHIDMLDPPPADALAAALEESVVFGYLRAAISDGQIRGHSLTGLGQIASRFSLLQMHHVQTLLAGYLWRVSIRDLALIVALYDERDPLLYMIPPSGPEQTENYWKTRQAALHAGLPAFLRKDDIDDEYYRARALIRDDFIEALLAFEGFVKALDSSQGDLSRLLDWCQDNGLDFEGVTKLASRRDVVINEMIVAGLNPFWGEEHRLADSAADFVDGVLRLKQCIYAGLRFSLVTNSGAGKYVAWNGEPVDVGPFHSGRLNAKNESLPRLFVTNTIRIRGAAPSKRGQLPPLLYRLKPGLISVLDDYVDVDEQLFDPREGSSIPEEKTIQAFAPPYDKIRAYSRLLTINHRHR